MNKNYRFIYLRNDYTFKRKSAPLGCVAIELTDNKHRVNYAVSVCNPADEFDRAQARQLALGRLLEKPISVVVPEAAPNMHDITRAVMLAVERSSAPTRARKAATNWIDSVFRDSLFLDLSDRSLDEGDADAF